MKRWLILSSISIGMATLAAAAPKTDAAYDRAADSHGFTVFMRDGGWCWYQDPRAIIHNGTLLMGAVKGNGSGPASVGVYDLEKGVSRGNVEMHADFDRDDHNSPAFYARPDGSVLAMYARHGREKVHYYRISDPHDYLKWGEEKCIDHTDVLSGRDKVTYMNLCYLAAEGTLYNFFRGINYNPTCVTSTDHGLSWGKDVHLIASEVDGHQRPYARYVGDGVDTVHISFTDAHPRDFGNSIYYAAFRKGGFYRADGSLIKKLDSDGPLRPSESERVFVGGGGAGRGAQQSASNSAWTCAIALDANQRPHLGYTYYLSNTDHRYRMAFWNGSAWIDREVAYAGKCLYNQESSYTGLIALDPLDPTVVFIASDVNPSTGEDTGGYHEIYRAEIGPDDDRSTIKWIAVTHNSPVRNIRPMILRDGTRRIVLWQRGAFKSYKDYDLDTIGFVETIQ